MQRLLATVDVAHLHTPWEPANLQIARLLRARGIPYVLTPHGMLDHWSMQQKRAKKILYLRLAGGRLIRNAAAVHFTAQSELEQARKWLSADATTSVQPCLLDLSAFDRPTSPDLALKAYPQIRSDAKKILFLSRVHPKKGLELLIEAAALLQEHAPLQLLVAGPGEPSYVSQLQKRASDLGVSACFLGMVQGEAKRSLYRLADVFVLPTYQENFGIVQAEAMASATPVVTTKGVDVWRELEQGGARIAEHDPPAIAAAVSPLLADSQLRDAVGAQGQTFVRQWLDEPRVAAGYQRMYQTAIGGAAASSLACPQTAGGQTT
jgi:glycosyltransferase involved in cell wall biosynthesis